MHINMNISATCTAGMYYKTIIQLCINDTICKIDCASTNMFYQWKINYVAYTNALNDCL